MKKYYTMKECFDACGDDDVPFIADRYNSLGKMSKKTLLTACPPTKWNDLNSEKWQIKRAEPKVLSADQYLERFYKYYKTLDHPEAFIGPSDVLYAFEAGDKNGQLRMWLRFKEYLDNEEYKEGTSISNPYSLETAIKNLKPPQ